MPPARIEAGKVLGVGRVVTVFIPTKLVAIWLASLTSFLRDASCNTLDESPTLGFGNRFRYGSRADTCLLLQFTVRNGDVL